MLIENIPDASRFQRLCEISGTRFRLDHFEEEAFSVDASCLMRGQSCRATANVRGRAAGDSARRQDNVLKGMLGMELRLYLRGAVWKLVG